MFATRLERQRERVEDLSDIPEKSPRWRWKPCVYRLSDRDGPELLLQVLLERNWRAHDEAVHGKQGWNLAWHPGLRVPVAGVDLQPWQFANHIPQAGLVTRKDRLVRCLRCMRLSFGTVYDFSPVAYVLPNEYVRFALEFSRLRDDHPAKNVWICKPSDQSRGRGISIFRQLQSLSYSSSAIVQRYLCNPLLVSGYKFDLRLYVCVVSYRPLVVYVYHDGLVRFATAPFDLRCLHNPYSHITNSSINKFSPAYDEGKGNVGLGCKWTLRQLRHYLAGQRVADWIVWQKIGHIILLTLLCEAPLVSTNSNSFELYGFDVIVDGDMTPWLLEVNRHPSLCIDCDVDVLVKKPLLHDLMDLLSVEETVSGDKVEGEDDAASPGASSSTSSSSISERRPQSRSASIKGRRIGGKSLDGEIAAAGAAAIDAKVGNGNSVRQRGRPERPHTSRPSVTSRDVPVPAAPVPSGTAWRDKWRDPPPTVGGFVRVFPCGNRVWRGPINTRGVVQYVRQLQRALLRVEKDARRRSDKRPLEDDEYQSALRNLMGVDDVLTWTPRK